MNEFTITAQYPQAARKMAKAILNGGFIATEALYAQNLSSFILNFSRYPLVIEGHLCGELSRILISCADQDTALEILNDFGFTARMENKDFVSFKVFRKA